MCFGQNSLILAKTHRQTSSKSSQWQTGPNKSKWHTGPNKSKCETGPNKSNWEPGSNKSKWWTCAKNSKWETGLGKWKWETGSNESKWQTGPIESNWQTRPNQSMTNPSKCVVQSTFWPNRIFERQKSQIRHTGFEFSPKSENSALSKKVVQHALFRSYGARFGHIACVRVKLLKIVTLASNSLKTGKQCAFHENCTKRSFQVMRSTFFKSHFWASKLSKPSHWPQILSKKEKIALSCTLFRSFLRSTFWPNRISERQSCQNRHTGLKFSPKRENIALSMKIVQNARFRSCAARFCQIAFVRVKVLKIVTLASNSLQNGKTVRFP